MKPQGLEALAAIASASTRSPLVANSTESEADEMTKQVQDVAVKSESSINPSAADCMQSEETCNRIQQPSSVCTAGSVPPISGFSQPLQLPDAIALQSANQQQQINYLQFLLNQSTSCLNTVSSVFPSMPAGGPTHRSQTVQVTVTEANEKSSAMLAPQPPVLHDDAQGIRLDDRKQQKRAANRRSAQLSRKRKKIFIDELKDENDELRRKEQILRSIPDLIVVFDSTGKLWFVSDSVRSFLSFSAAELIGTSFWDRLCEDSVRRLKAAFMDSLAAPRSDSETASLGSGVWELRLIDKDESYKVVVLNGVVHFAGERPECVCSIRSTRIVGPGKSGSATAIETRTRIDSHRSVMDAAAKSQLRKTAVAVRISDGGNSSVESETGSSDEQPVLLV